MVLACATYFDKVDEVIVIFTKNGISDWVAALAAALGHSTAFRSDQPPILIEKVLSLAALIYHLFRRHANPDNE